MPEYNVTSPSGQKFRVTAPEGATQDEILARVQQHSGQQDLSIGETLTGAVFNAPSSAVQFAKNVAQPILHPIETAKNVGRLGLGVGEKLGVPGTQGYGQYADAVGQFFKERYGGYENVKRTIANDPVGFIADIASVSTLGGGVVPKLGQVGRALNPLKATKLGEAITPIIGTATGSGAQGIRDIAAAGFKGGAASRAALENMRNPEAFQSALVANARKALGEVRAERSSAYQKGMAAIGKIQTPLDFAEIDKALTQAARIKSFQGVPVSKLAGAIAPMPAEKTLTQIWSAIQQWKKLPRDTYHTPAGFDALKQYVGDIKDGLQFNTPERKVAEEAYGAIRNTIVKQAPDYANVMKDYEQASTLLEEITKTLSLGKKASEDTALRKLLSTTRSGVNTNFGKRAELAQELGKWDPTLVPSLAGQSLAGWVPQGLVGKGVAGTLAAGAGYAHSPLSAAALPFTSPRLVGETAHALGRGAGMASNLTPQMVKNLLKRVNPDILRQVLLLTSRGGQNAPQ